MASPLLKAESGLQMLSRLSGCKGSSISDLQPSLFPTGLLQPHQVVELRANEGSISSRLCSHLLERCILPISIGGLELDAIFVDTEHQLQIHHLASALELALRKGGLDRKQVQNMLKYALGHLVIIQCFNSTQLLACMHSLPQLIRSRQNKVGLVVIDSPASYYQSDLLFEANPNNAKISKEHHLADVLSPLLNSEINQLNLVLTFTLPTSFKRSFVTNNLPNKSYSVFMKPADMDASSGTGNDNECYQVILYKGKDFVRQTSFTLVENELIWKS